MGSGSGIRWIPGATSQAPSAVQCSPESGETAYAVGVPALVDDVIQRRLAPQAQATARGSALRPSRRVERKASSRSPVRTSPFVPFEIFVFLM